MSKTAENKKNFDVESLKEIPINKIVNFPGHPYQVRDDESMVELVESIRTRGLLQPVLVRQMSDGKYEMVSGHRRKRAFEIAGIETIPARVHKMTRDEAILEMVDSNLCREEILPSEKGFAYKMRLEAMKRQAGRPPKNPSPVATNFPKGRTDDELGELVGESKDQIRRYIRLTYLNKDLLNLVDEKKIALRPAVEISYLTEEQQGWLYEAITFNEATPSHAQTIRMRELAANGKLDKTAVDNIMSEDKPNQRPKPAFKDERINNLIPQNISAENQTDYVVKALEFYKKHREKSKDAR